MTRISKRIAAITGLGIATLACTTIASAHHSVAAYDRQNQVFVAGTIKDFHWGNPHTWIYMMVPDGKGRSDEWRLEGPSVNGLARSGWRSTSLKPGDKAKLVVAPNRNGTVGGEFLRVVEINGKAPQLITE